jgi:hypothetical protein
MRSASHTFSGGLDQGEDRSAIVEDFHTRSSGSKPGFIIQTPFVRREGDRKREKDARKKSRR